MLAILNKNPKLLLKSLLIIGTGYHTHTAIIVAGLIFMFAIIYFYRDPHIKMTPNSDNYLVSPGFGTVIQILALNENKIQISIFLNIFNIHTQHYPCRGKVLGHIYDRTAQFSIASDLYKSDANEKTITTLNSYDTNDIITIIQIAGLVAQRISTKNNIHMNVSQGEYMGLIHFGSRVDIIFSSDKYILLPGIRPGAYLDGPNSKVAVIR